MRGLRDRLRWRRGHRADEPATGRGVNRRTVLIGAAASAGVVATGASPALASTQSPARAAAAAAPDGTTATVAASDVSVVPAGEIIDTDAQSVLEALDSRLSKTHLIDDLQVAMTLVDDFMGNTATSGTIGQLGWALGVGATGTAAVGTAISVPGMFKLGTGTTATGWQNLNLGNNSLLGRPVLMGEWRVRLGALNAAPDTYSCWFGLFDNLLGVEPATGFYFRYTASDGPNWQAVCANAGARTVVNSNIAADVLFHRFRFTCDGTAIARFYIDDGPIPPITTTLPDVKGYAPNAAIRKTAGTTTRLLNLDYFALRYEQAR